MWVLQVKLETINEYNKFVQHLNLGKEFDYSLILDMINLINISEASNERFVDSVDEIEKLICAIAKLIKNINNDLEGVHNDINDLRDSLEIIGETLYIDLTLSELPEIVRCDDCEYDESKWVFNSNVDILLPYKSDYIVDLINIAGDGIIVINGLRYDMSEHLKIHLSSVELIDISSLDSFSISLIKIFGGIKQIEKLSELENDIIDIEDDTLIIIK